MGVLWNPGSFWNFLRVPPILYVITKLTFRQVNIWDSCNLLLNNNLVYYTPIVLRLKQNFATMVPSAGIKKNILLWKKVISAKETNNLKVLLDYRKDIHAVLQMIKRVFYFRHGNSRKKSKPCSCPFVVYCIWYAMKLNIPCEIATQESK